MQISLLGADGAICHTIQHPPSHIKTTFQFQDEG